MRRFQSFRLDTANQCLWHGEARVELTPKAFGVLRYLVEHPGRLITQEELLEALWPATYINPEVLRKYVLEIRRALGDRPDKPVFIETRPKRGYQFVASVVDESAAGTLSAQGTKRIVGREPVLAELGGYLRRAQRKERQVLFITGEAGIGKTALADEFQRQALVDEPGIRIARGQCVEGYGGKEAYYPILEALGQLCQGSEVESIVQILATQAPTWLVQFPPLVNSKQREMLQREILSATRERMLREIGEALETIASEKTLLLVLEDLHWADLSTIDLISALARRRAPAKLMLIGTYRPVDVTLAEHPLKAVKQDLLVHRLGQEIPLQPLEEADVAEYLAIEAGGAAGSEGLARLISRRTEGNPLFMVAALDHMQDRGLIAVENGSWQIKVPMERIDLEAPESLRQMIELQIERLSKEEQRVLEVASVTGALFTTSVHATEANMDAERFEDLCEGLARRHQIVRSTDSKEFPDGTTSAGYEFVHAMYREVLYNRQSAGRRVKIHLHVGERLEALYAQRPSEVAPELAQHFEQGRDWLRAIKYLQLAADTAGQRFEPRQAADILGHALNLVKKLPDAERGGHETMILERMAKIYGAWLRKATGWE
ncbi:MAG: AAA family ATPase [Acidobacteriaceae bacterium]|nr:AAA family ATPase [Acidobacteriaceae bacterium]